MAQTIPIIMMVASVASTAVGVYSAISGGKAKEETYGRQAAQMVASAEQTRKSAAQEAADAKKQHQRIVATQAARYGASGLTMEGTPLLVQMETLKESEDQLQRIIEGGEIRAKGYESGAYEATQVGEQAVKSGYVQAGSSLLSGIGSVYKTGKEYNWW